MTSVRHVGHQTWLSSVAGANDIDSSVCIDSRNYQQETYERYANVPTYAVYTVQPLRPEGFRWCREVATYM